MNKRILALGGLVMVIFIILVVKYLAWILAFGGLGFVVLAIVTANKLRSKFPTAQFPNGIDAKWESAIIPSIGFLLVHLALWWMRPVSWTLWYESNGFILLQIATVFGLYAMSLEAPASQTIGKGLVFVGVLGLGLIVWGTFNKTHPDVFPSTAVVTAKAEAEQEKKAYEALLPFDPNGEVVVAPVGGRSDMIPTHDGLRYDPDDDIIIWDDHGRRHNYSATTKKTDPPLGPTEWIKIQSGIREPVNVIISR